MSPPHAPSLCHRCEGCQVVISGRGSIFLRCDRRAEKYLAQPVMQCAAFAALPVVDARSARGVTRLAWIGAAPVEGVAVADGAGGLVMAGIAAPPVSAAAGDALWWEAGGLRLVRAAGRGPVVARVVAGVEALVGLPAGSVVRFEGR